jgi:hypothetical protein
MQYTIGSFVLIATVTLTLGGAAHLYMGGTDGETTGRIATALGAEGPAIAGGDVGGDDADDIGFDLSAAADMLPGFEPESVLAVAGLPGIPGIPKFGKKGDGPFGALPVAKREKKDRKDRDLPPGDRPRGDPDDPDCTGTSCNKPGKQCFGAGTLVVTPDGLVPIEALALGDEVLTRSTSDEPLVERTITALHETPGKPILEIWIQEDGAEPELIEVTPRHPFWVADEGWVDSDQLAPGDQLSTADGDAASVLSVASTARTETVYNLTIDEHHTYFVGTSETWVHNVDGCDEETPEERAERERKERERQERVDSLAPDPAHNGKITKGSRREAEVGVALEERGDLPGPITRDPSGFSEFIDANGQMWDVKGFSSKWPIRRGGFHLETAMEKIDGEISNKENVILDTKDLSPEHLAELRAAVAARRDLDGKILWYPE